MSKFVLPLMTAVLMLLVVLGSARLLEGDEWNGGKAASGEHHPVGQFLEQRYLQRLQLQARASCRSYSTTTPPCPPHHRN
uniref:Uncharacterized protein n=1 Tax=Setaria viridis TaxID=4556 RepID=A0A4U6WR57_SETVI|nr:hypothetical protein SEVIR_1G318900v2 [Setaria viridis]